MRFASFGRALDPKARVERLIAGLGAARDAGAVHLVISGDVTELGTPDQFETFAEVLHDARIDPDRVTIVPGNHDAYTHADAWKCALEGPLARFRRASACHEGSVVERAKAFVLPLDVACHQQCRGASWRPSLGLRTSGRRSARDRAAARRAPPRRGSGARAGSRGGRRSTGGRCRQA